MTATLKSFIIMGALFPLVFSLALLLAQPYKIAGYTTNTTQSDPMNVVAMVVVIAIGTVVMLFVPKMMKDEDWLRAVFIGLIAYSTLDVTKLLASYILPPVYTTITSIAVMVSVAVFLLNKPEWYVIDAIGIFIAVNAIATLGMSISVLLAVVLLIGLLVYDTIAVYKSKHMILLAKNVMKMKLPVIMIIPTSLPYSWLSEEDPFSDKSKRKAYIMGLGDLVFPGILVISVQSNVQNPVITISTVIGIMVGYVGVSYFASKGKAQAGLPFLCGGAILGFIISSLLVYGRLMI